MPARNPRISTVVDEELARFYADEEERFWAKEGEGRLETFDPDTAVSHEKAWS